MSVEERVREWFPKAYAERHKKVAGGGYTLIWSSHALVSHRIGEGKTKEKAWRDALRRIRERTEPVK